MPLASGTRIGVYEILSPLGAGGMGEVYRARDTRLGRDVALKILPPLFAADADRLARFEREAQVLASLNHPHIAHIHGLEESGETRALVMELVNGEDLAAHIARGPMPPGDAVRIARQIAEALEAAHERGIIHRDLKPANVKVTTDGTVKVLDFGLAKALDAEAASAPAGATMTSPVMTGMGIILGTAAYMSPEQARGTTVDRRSDIWSFGVVLMEMLTGRALFAGDTVSDIVAAVLTRDPDLAALPDGTPAAVRHLLARCLERDQKRRLRDIGEARIVLEGPLSSPASERQPSTRSSWRTHLLWLAALVAVAAVAALAASRWTIRAPAVRRFSVVSPNRTAVTNAVLSPNGRTLAFISDDKAWVLQLDELTPRELPESVGARAIFWAPDSAAIGFQARGRLWKAGLAGAAPIAMATIPLDFSAAGGAAWLADGRIVFTTGGTGLQEVASEGGAPRVILDVDRSKEADFHSATALPDGRGVIFVVHQVKGEHAIDAFDGTRRTRVYTSPGGSILDPFYSPSGHILFFRDTGTWALPFSLSTLQATGEPFMAAAGGGDPSVSVDGTLAVVPAGAMSDAQLTWFGRDGRAQGTLGRGGLRIRQPRLSPDGRFAAATVFEANDDIWIFDVERGTDRRLTFEPEDDSQPAWSPDGAFIVYQCGRAICSRRADGTGQRHVVIEAPASGPAVSPDGRHLVFEREQPQTNLDLFVVELSPAGLQAAATVAPRPFVVDRFQQGRATISPDGRYVAYQSNETGVFQIYLTRFPSGDGKWQVSTDTVGFVPRWTTKGDRLLFVASNDLREVDIETEPQVAIGKPRPLFRIGELIPLPYISFDRAVDSSRFLVPWSSSRGLDESHIVIIENWLTELTRGRTK